MVGIGAGEGFNVNVAWNIAWKDKEGMGDDEYLAACQRVLLPIALNFNPQLILVSAGFDAACGDVGMCSVTPRLRKAHSGVTRYMSQGRVGP